MSACPQSWRVEAARDGVLPAAECAKFASHAESCFHCEAEATRLAKIGDALRQIPVAEPNPFAVRSARRRLLEAAASMSKTERHAGVARAPRLQRGPAFRVWLAAAAAVVLIAGGVRYAPRMQTALAVAPAPRPVVAAMAAAIEVRAASDARWLHRSDTSTERITLDEGTLWVKVAHNGSEQRLVFRVPDGEVADIGTTFSVTVHNGRTNHVTVEEGVVEVRLQGLAEVTLRAGQSWERHEEPTAALESAQVSEAVLPSAAPARATSQVTRSRHRHHAVVRIEHSRTERTANPSPGRAEDAAYLRVLSLERAGHLAEARAEARNYLVRFPAGFRRMEMEAFASATFDR